MCSKESSKPYLVVPIMKMMMKNAQVRPKAVKWYFNIFAAPGENTNFEKCRNNKYYTKY